LPQQNQRPKPPIQCERPDVEGTFKVGVFAEVTVPLGPIRFNVEVNLITVNIPSEGPSYLTQGFGVGLKDTGRLPLFLGLDRTSHSGGLDWEPVRWFGGADPIEASREGLSAKASAGAIVGGEVAVNNLQNLIPCAQ
jgi:hypothetical protein